MMKEKNCKELVNRYLLNLMSEEEETAFQKHLLECDECRAYLEKLRTTRDALTNEDNERSVDLKPKFDMAVEHGNVVRSVANKRRLRYYGVAAVLLLLLISGLVVFIVNEHSGQVSDYNNIAKVADTGTVVSRQVERVVWADTVSPSEVAKEPVKRMERADAQQEHTYVVSKGKNPPNVARAVVVTGGAVSDESRSYLLPDEGLKFGEIINPKELVNRLRVENDSVFEFKWNVYYDTPFFIYIKPNGGVMENYHDTGDVFRLNLKEYRDVDSLEWNVKIMGDTGAIRHKGVIYFEK